MNVGSRPGSSEKCRSLVFSYSYPLVFIPVLLSFLALAEWSISENFVLLDHTIFTFFFRNRL